MFSYESRQVGYCFTIGIMCVRTRRVRVDVFGCLREIIETRHKLIALVDVSQPGLPIYYRYSA